MNNIDIDITFNSIIDLLILVIFTNIYHICIRSYISNISNSLLRDV